MNHKLLRKKSDLFLNFMISQQSLDFAALNVEFSSLNFMIQI